MDNGHQASGMSWRSWAALKSTCAAEWATGGAGPGGSAYTWHCVSGERPQKAVSQVVTVSAQRDCDLRRESTMMTVRRPWWILSTVQAEVESWKAHSKWVACLAWSVVRPSRVLIQVCMAGPPSPRGRMNSRHDECPGPTRGGAQGP